MTHQCTTCGRKYEGLPDIALQWPDPYFGVPEPERERRIVATTDTCVIDDDDFFIRGVILLPIRGENLDLGLGVWVSQKRENFQTYMPTTPKALRSIGRGSSFTYTASPVARASGTRAHDAVAELPAGVRAPVRS